jgi:hypothetical protein
VLKGQDIVVVIHLLEAPAEWTLRELGGELGLVSAPMHRSLGRLAEAGLYDAPRRRVVTAAAEEFLIHGVPYVFPVRPLGESRGVPAAWAALPLSELLASGDPLPPVWPAPNGKVRGLALEPLHPSALRAAAHNPATAERLALVDALRAGKIGGTRVRSLAARELRRRLTPTASAT